MTTENWLPVVGFEGFYEVSDHGKVRSLARVVPGRWNKARTRRAQYPIRESILVPTHAKRTGHHRVKLSRDGHAFTLYVHALVLEAFVGPRCDGMQACHNDGDVGNNTVDNLRWDTPASNARDRLSHGTDANARKTHCPSGHEYNAENTYLYDGGTKRRCRPCARAATNAWRGRRAAA